MSTLEVVMLAGWALTTLAGVFRILWGKEAKLTRIVTLLAEEIELIPHMKGLPDSQRVGARLKLNIKSMIEDPEEAVLAPLVRRAERIAVEYRCIDGPDA